MGKRILISSLTTTLRSFKVVLSFCLGCNIFSHQASTSDRNVLISKDIKPPHLELLIKDHKASRDDGGKPTRPVCLASSSPNGVLSDLLGDIADKIADDINPPSECLSTEDLCKEIIEANKKLSEIDEDFHIGSMDAKNLYSSLKVEEVIKNVQLFAS